MTTLFLMVMGSLTLTAFLLAGVLFLEATGRFVRRLRGRVEFYQARSPKQSGYGIRMLGSGK